MTSSEVLRTYRVYCQRAALHFGVLPEHLSSRMRTDDVVQAKRVVWLALQADGVNPAAIARAADRDHSTVVHGLARAQHNELLQRLAASIRVLDVPDRFNAGALGLLYRDAAGLREYCRWLVGHGHFTAPALTAIRLLAARPQLRAALAEACSDYEVANHLWRARIHAQQINARWVEETVGEA